MYYEAKRMDIPEVSGDRAIRDFLLAVESVDPTYGNGRQEARNTIEDQNLDLDVNQKLRQRTMDEEIERFRNRIRLQQNSSVVKTARSAFTTDTKPSLKGKDQQGIKVKSKPPLCICGEKMYYADCPYLVPSKAPTGWKEDSSVRKNVDNALKDSKLQARVKKNLETREKIVKASSALPVNNSFTQSATPVALSTTMYPTVMSTTVYSALATNVSGIESYLIHDAGSNAHVCNSRSAHLYTKIREASSDEYLGSGTGVVKIESWGVIETAFESPNGLIPILLENVAFVGSFVTSLVSQSVLDSKGVYFDTGGPCLYQNGITKFLLHRNDGHFTFTAMGHPHLYPQHAVRALSTTAVTPTVCISNTKTKPIKERSAIEWHKIMAHVSGEAIRHLQDSAADVKVLGSSVPSTSQCETCALTKSQQIISRSSRKSEGSSNPFCRISVDLMQFDPALNGHEWATHIACMSTDFNMVDTSRTKAECRGFILDTITLIKRQFHQDVVFIRSDNEGSFSHAFEKDLKNLGITLEESAPNTPAQNGHAERKGKMLAVKARALRIGADFPHYLWVETIYAACYLANRTPMAKHN